MTERPTEVFHADHPSPTLLGSLGMVLLVLVGFLALEDIRTLSLLSVGTQFLLLLAAIGVAMIVRAVQQSRTELRIGPDGVSFTRAGEIHPWSTLGGIRLRRPFNDLVVFDLHGSPLGVLAAMASRFERAALLLSLGISPKALKHPEGRFLGHYGWLKWVAFFFIALSVVYDRRLDSITSADWFLIGVLIVGTVLGLRNLVKGWRETGSYEVGIDREGIRFRGRAGSWAVRWAEVGTVRADIGPGARIEVDLLDGRLLFFPLPPSDLHDVLSALRTHGGAAVASLTPGTEEEFSDRILVGG